MNANLWQYREVVIETSPSCSLGRRAKRSAWFENRRGTLQDMSGDVVDALQLTARVEGGNEQRLKDASKDLVVLGPPSGAKDPRWEDWAVRGHRLHLGKESTKPTNYVCALKVRRETREMPCSIASWTRDMIVHGDLSLGSKHLPCGWHLEGHPNSSFCSAACLAGMRSACW
jgi:hypothetical protein